MIDYAIISVSQNFLTLLIAVAAIMPFIGVAVGLFIYRMTIGPAAKAAWAAKRKKAPSLFHMGRDGIFKLWAIARSFGGVWHAGNVMDVIPDERSVRSLLGGTPTGIAATNAAATLDVEWIYNTNRFADAYAKETTLEGGGVKVPKMSPPMAANYLDALRYRKAEVIEVLDTLGKIEGGEISLEDGVLAEMSQKGYNPDDEAMKAKLRAVMLGAMASKGEAYRKELVSIQAAEKINFTEDRWVIDWEAKPTKGSFFKKGVMQYTAKAVMAVVPIRMGDFQAFLQTGANLDDLTTALRNSTMAALLENTLGRGQTFKWISLGVFIFIVFLSIYVIMTGLHLT